MIGLKIIKKESLYQEVKVHSEMYDAMAKSVMDGEVEDAKGLAHKAIAEDIDPLDAINNGYVVGINVIGEKFSNGQCFLPELVMAGEAMKSALSVLEPEMEKRGTERKVLGNVVLATIQGDIHDIGKTLVGIMLSSNGFRVYDMGVDVNIETIIQQAKEVGFRKDIKDLTQNFFGSGFHQQPFVYYCYLHKKILFPTPYSHKGFRQNFAVEP